MIITYHGLEFFKVQFGDLVIGINPTAGKKFGADIALVTMPHEDFSATENLAYGGKEPFVINGAGEYEVKGVSIRGFESKTAYEKEEMWNTIYLLTLEDTKICFLGALSNPALPPEAKEHMEDVNILFTPIGGGSVLAPAESYKLAVELDANIVIPMHYEGAEGEKNLKVFLKEGGLEKISPVEKLTVKKKDVAGKEGEIIVLAQS